MAATRYIAAAGKVATGTASLGAVCGDFFGDLLIVNIRLSCFISPDFLGDLEGDEAGLEAVGAPSWGVGEGLSLTTPVTMGFSSTFVADSGFTAATGSAGTGATSAAGVGIDSTGMLVRLEAGWTASCTTAPVGSTTGTATSFASAGANSSIRT